MRTRTVRRALEQVLALLVASVARSATLTVTNTNDSGAGSLRQAIFDANSGAGTDTIEFNIPGGGPYVITPLPPGLPAMTGPTIVDGTTQPGVRRHAHHRDRELQRVRPETSGRLEHDSGDPRARHEHRHRPREQQQQRRGLLRRHGHDGHVAAGNGNGTGIIVQSGTTGNPIGGSAAARRNVISGDAAGIGTSTARTASSRATTSARPPTAPPPSATARASSQPPRPELIIGGSGAGKGT